MSYIPGPWEMRRDGFVYAANGERVCSPHSTLPDSAKWSEQLKDLKANARLISAAPDLYEALQEIVDATDTGWEHLDATFTRAREALKKARGER